MTNVSHRGSIALTDLESNTIYNYYILITDTIDKSLTPANIQYITLFVSSADGITLTEEGRANADVSFDDTLTFEDVLQILRYVVEVSHSFSA